MSELITAELVDLDLSAATKDAAARSLAERMVAAHRVTDLDGFLSDVAAREAQMPTGLDGGIGIPHCRSEHVSAPTLAFGRSASGIDFGAADGPADLIFLIAAPAGADDDHLTILSGLARRLMDPEFTAALRAGNDPGTVAALIRGEEPVPEPEATTPIPAAGEAAPAGDDAPFRIVAVTSCPTGIAHTYMAAESLTAAGLAEGVEVTVETQGVGRFQQAGPRGHRPGRRGHLGARRRGAGEGALRGKPLVDVGVKAGINRPAELIAEARRKAERGEIAAVPQGGDGPESGADGGSGAEGAHFGVRLRTI
ncbi:protein-N(pi)-phosphohistidine--D-fructose phosphotransferase OS=Streptomyces microflavus OX=1919 GN=Smic_81820 PE=4 SV=1 [Streptomyces microflavus]